MSATNAGNNGSGEEGQGSDDKKKYKAHKTKQQRKLEKQKQKQSDQKSGPPQEHQNRGPNSGQPLSDPNQGSDSSQAVGATNKVPPKPADTTAAKTTPEELYYHGEAGLRRLARQPVRRYNRNEYSQLSIGISTHEAKYRRISPTVAATTTRATNSDGSGGSAQGVEQFWRLAPEKENFLHVRYKYKTDFYEVIRCNNCQISGLFYIGAYRFDGPQSPVTQHKDTAEITGYWTDRARKQFGAHVFAIRNSDVVVTVLRAVQDKNIPLGFSWTSMAPINTLYPCVRLEPQTITTKKLNTEIPLNGLQWEERALNDKTKVLQYWYGEYWLTLGLLYDGPAAKPEFYNRGDRYYVRYGQYADSKAWGHVWELTDPWMECRLRGLAGPQLNDKDFALQFATPGAAGTSVNKEPAKDTCWAVYVCAGAKLVVNDSYHKDVTDKHHNRALVQQGGVVAGRGPLVFSGPIHENNREYFSVGDVVGQKKHGFALSDKSSDAMRAKLANIKNPVLFLAPLESEYGSIAWELDIHHPVKGDPRVCVVSIPESAWFAAIEDWGVGIEEILARHRYEQLYQQNVQTNHISHIFRGFRTPDLDMANKIVGVGDDRRVSTNIMTSSQLLTDARTACAPIPQPLPVIYKCRTVTDWNYAYSSSNSLRPPMPPDWPMVCYDGRFKDFRKNNEYFQMANGLWKTRDTEGVAIPADCLYGLKHGNDTVADTYNMYERKDSYKGALNHYTKVATDAVTAPFDGKNYYMGIDGWVYSRVGTSIGYCKNDWYQLRAQPPPASVQAPGV